MKLSDFTDEKPGRLDSVKFGPRGEQETWAFVPDPLPPKVNRHDFVGRVADELVVAERSLATLGTLVDSLPNPSILLLAMRRREAMQSSLIEDTKTTAQQFMLAEANLVSRSEINQDVTEVQNNFRAIEFGMNDARPVCLDMIKEMQAILVKGARGHDKEPGQFRTIQVQIGGDPERPDTAKFLPQPPGPQLVESMQAYERFLHPNIRGGTARETFPDLIELALNHYQFECIHPFRDGNGRIGRAIINIHPCKSGWLRHPVLNVSTAIERRRETYCERLRRVSTHNDWEAWVKFFLEVIAEQAQDDLKRVRGLHAVREESIKRVYEAQSSGITMTLIDTVFRSMAVTASHVQEALGITAPTARKHIARLCDIGLLVEIRGGDWGRIYGSRVLLDIVDATTGENAMEIANRFVTSPPSPSPSPGPSRPG